MKCLWPGALLFIVSLTSISCSKLEWAVDWADTFIVREADKYFDLTSEQKKGLKKSVRQGIEKTKCETFPLISQFLNEASEKFRKDEFSQNDVDFIYDKAFTFVPIVRAHFISASVELLKTVNDKQLKNFQDYFSEKTTEIQDRVNDLKDWQKFDEKRLKKSLERWVESLDSNQTKKIREFSQQNAFPAKEQIKNRTVMLTKFINYQKARDFENIEAFLRKLEIERDPEYAKALEAYGQNLKKFIFYFYKELESPQKKFVVKQFSTYASQLEKMSCNTVN